MPWSKGKSGNQKGRPAKGRVLAQALRDTGAFDSYGDLTNQQLLARMVWEGLALGTITFSSDRTLELNVQEWLELVKWVHAHVDGSYRPEPEEADEDERPLTYLEQLELDRIERHAAVVRRAEESRQAEEARQAEALRQAEQQEDTAEQGEAVQQPEGVESVENAPQEEEAVTAPAEDDPVIVVFGKEDFALSEWLLDHR